MKIKKLLASAVVACALSVGAAHAAELTIHGSTTVNTYLFGPHKAQLEEMTGLKLNVVGNGSSRGITGLDNGADMGMVSSSLDTMLKKTKMEDRAAEFVGNQVGEGELVFVVHPSNPVTAVSEEQLKGMLSGTIKNWSEVGGSNMPIIIVTEFKGGGMRSTAEKKILSKNPITGNVRELQNGPQIPKVASQLPPALGVVAKAMIEGTNLRPLETKKIIQPLVLVTKGTPNADAQKLIDAAKDVLK